MAEAKFIFWFYKWSKFHVKLEWYAMSVDELWCNRENAFIGITVVALEETRRCWWNCFDSSVFVLTQPFRSSLESPQFNLYWIIQFHALINNKQCCTLYTMCNCAYLIFGHFHRWCVANAIEQRVVSWMRKYSRYRLFNVCQSHGILVIFSNVTTYPQAFTKVNLFLLVVAACDQIVRLSLTRITLNRKANRSNMEATAEKCAWYTVDCKLISIQSVRYVVFSAIPTPSHKLHIGGVGHLHTVTICRHVGGELKGCAMQYIEREWKKTEVWHFITGVEQYALALA